ncbi:putative adhesin [Falsiroseomonas sp. E2-1-a20]|uniref:putative adhesin n=1 Tax=Falsiroseomonas sp. E2-1-a20 TaxID=3239300 RepID=UPI003F2FF5E0
MPIAQLGSKWERHYKAGSRASEAYLVSHGSYSENGFTDLVSPSNIHFYVFQSHTMYTVEILQIFDFKARIKTSDEGIVSCKRKIATSIMGARARCWNYYLAPWDKKNYDQFKDYWMRGSGPDADLIIMEPTTGSLGESLFGSHDSNMNELLSCLNSHGLAYQTIHFLCCRSVAGATPRAEPGSTTPLYKSSNPYWPGL